MKYWLNLLLIIIVFSGCHGSVDESRFERLRNKAPAKEQMLGIWETDSSVKALIKGKGTYRDLPLSFTLLENHTFVGKNFPDFLSSKDFLVSNGELFDASGTWELSASSNNVQLYLNFDKGQLYPNGFGCSTVLYKRKVDNKIVVFWFLGDADMGQVIKFTK